MSDSFFRKALENVVVEWVFGKSVTIEVRDLFGVLDARFVPSALEKVDSTAACFDAKVSRLKAWKLLESLVGKLLDDVPLWLDIKRGFFDASAVPLRTS